MKVRELIGKLLKADPEMIVNVSIAGKREKYFNYVFWIGGIDAVWTEEYKGEKSLYIGLIGTSSAEPEVYVDEL